ncbi:hypothetical protein FC19_GL002104 [Liquorilactobacillus aquaticus DSM 21051]|uniref:Uncharacterized protein n=1 Tax=Liquorilactobacillus aquaticus DSM 21051 TaxID=1423725 RepID=A0A0R2D050_9LACO|nr:hypothetical protein [Liquorilactobacillus aquaticus]KRM95252.1 hypothetical protein FC19_GL002104 [Liquorilactobacillus aquaticus DSM 21051]
MHFYINLTNNLKLQIDPDTIVTGYRVSGNPSEGNLEKVISTSFSEWHENNHSHNQDNMLSYLACMLTHIDWFSIGAVEDNHNLFNTNSVQSIIKL